MAEYDTDDTLFVVAIQSIEIATGDRCVVVIMVDDDGSPYLVANPRADDGHVRGLLKAFADGRWSASKPR